MAWGRKEEREADGQRRKIRRWVGSGGVVRAWARSSGTWELGRGEGVVYSLRLGRTQGGTDVSE